MKTRLHFLILAAILLPPLAFAAGNVTLRIDTWTNPSTITALEELNARFTQKYSNIKVELTNSPTDQFQQSNPLRIQAGDVDIWSGFGFAQRVQSFHTKGVQLAAAYQNIEAGLVEPLDGEAFVKNYKPDAVKDGMTYKGKVYGVCMGSVVIAGYFYNKDLFAKYNLKVPRTFGELVKACETFKANGIAPITAAGGPVWPIDMIMVGFVGPIFKDSNILEKSLWTGGPGFQEPKYIEALTKYQRLMLNYYEPGFQTIDYNPHVGRFASGAVAMLADGIWQANSIAEAGGPSFNFGYMQVPASDTAADNQAYYGKYDLMWFVHSKSKLKKEAKLWLSFISEPANYTKFINAVGWMPTQNVTVKNRILDEVSKFPMKLSFEQIHLSRTGQGEMAGGQVHFLTPMGTIASPEELARKAQADWNAAGGKQ